MTDGKNPGGPSFDPAAKQHFAQQHRDAAPPLTPFGINQALQSFDAEDWARVFLQFASENPALPHDLDTMRGWFANALMRGYDERSRRDEVPPPVPVKPAYPEWAVERNLRTAGDERRARMAEPVDRGGAAGRLGDFRPDAHPINECGPGLGCIPPGTKVDVPNATVGAGASGPQIYEQAIREVDRQNDQLRGTNYKLHDRIDRSRSLHGLRKQLTTLIDQALDVELE